MPRRSMESLTLEAQQIVSEIDRLESSVVLLYFRLWTVCLQSPQPSRLKKIVGKDKYYRARKVYLYFGGNEEAARNCRDSLRGILASISKATTASDEEEGELPVSRSDEYYTPDEATDLICPYLPKGKVIWECAWGLGHMARYLRSEGHAVVGAVGVDFLKDNLDCDIIVTNPPFSLKTEFLHRAYQIGKPFAFLLPADALVGLDRHPLFREKGIQLLVPSRRIQYIFDSDSHCGFNSVWFCWSLLPQDVVFANMKPHGTLSKAMRKADNKPFLSQSFLSQQHHEQSQRRVS